MVKVRYLASHNLNDLVDLDYYPTVRVGFPGRQGSPLRDVRSQTASNHDFSVLQVDVADSSPDTLAQVATSAIALYLVFAQRHEDPNHSDLHACCVLMDWFYSRPTPNARSPFTVINLRRTFAQNRRQRLRNARE
jgi:hypothetical protein